ncbi:hypothetical protein VOLCADRAFT_118653, partial [Volvox carteri f. nagariensis]
MSSKAPHPTDADTDPGKPLTRYGWYPAQPECQDEPEPAAEPLSPSGDAAKRHSVLRFGGAVSGLFGIPASVPTVLTKLQKWGDYESVGRQVLPTKFIPMKTPLSAEILNSWSLPSQPKHRLTVPEMVAQQAALGRKVGLLLDLSNHDCLYTDDIPPWLTYRHIQLVAKELPPPEFVDTVVAVANKFWEKHPDEYIAVHCAYGFNRTGFVVCCYLIECCGLNVEAALSAFAESRPPGVKHEQFRNELHRRYGNVMHGTVPHGVYGSPDDNSSFGYSPSCGSLDLRDLIVGGAGSGSPIPGLTRGSTFDCLLGVHHHSVAASGAGGGSSSSPGVAHRHSMDGHQTLTVTMSSFTAAEFRGRSINSGLKQPLLQPAAAAATVAAAGVQVHPHQQHQHPHSSPQLPPCVATPPTQVRQAQVAARQQQLLQLQAGGHATPQKEEHEQQQEQWAERRQSQEGGGLRQSQGGKYTSQQQQQQQQGWQQLEELGCRQSNGVFRGQHGSEVRWQDSDRRGLGSGVAGGAQGSMSSLASASAASAVSASGESAASGEEARGSVMNRVDSQQQLQQSCCGGGSGGVDNESLGVNDRAVLLALRQQALAQLSGKTIPEESDSSQSTPCGCSSISLADGDSTAGHCTPRQAQQGRHSYKSLDAIDWGRQTGRLKRDCTIYSVATASTFTTQKDLSLRNGAHVKVIVEQTEKNDQIISIESDVQAGRLLLHWGVEGGKDYKGGWRLPGASARPEGTVQYKDRALQTPFRLDTNGRARVVLHLDGEEASDFLNFVLKARFGSDARVDQLPKDLCDKWAWVRWDHAGRPERAGAAAANEYDRGVAEMRELLARGRTLDELWRVAEGKWKYSDYRKKQQQQKPANGNGNGVAALPRIPDDLLGVQAYVLWERAGKPDGADFSGEARRVITEQLQSGATLEEVGAPLGTPKRNPLDMIKRSAPAPVLSAERHVVERPLDFLVQRFAVDPSTRWRRTYPLGSKAELLVVVRQENEQSPVRVDLVTDTASNVVLHWGVCPPGSREWTTPDDSLHPEGSVVMHKAVETPFLNCDDDECDVEISGAKVPLQRITINLRPDHHVGAVTFVLRSSDSTMWYKDAGGNFVVPLPSKDEPVEAQAPDVAKDELSRSIVEAEVNSSQWTLMHRFNKAADLIYEVLNGYYEIDVAAAMSRIFVWLRFSATRHLTWQRNYNTQPRILSAAQERLTNAISNAHGRTSGEAQEWVRAMLTTVGRGGDGQKIRDEILHIMHRNHIPERKGLWMEEWHQKLHNNTTPDDVHICEAYLAFLESGGNLGAYWRVLSDAGITRQRLESFDRAITLEPEYYGDKRDALIRDFRNYLGILKAVHSGADLSASASAAGNRIPAGARGWLAYVLSHVGDSQILPLLEACVEARTELAPALTGNRELLYLDLALEDQVRQAAERGVGSAGFGAAAFMRPLLQNLCLSLGNNEEICYCLKAWNELPSSVRNGGRPSKEEALLAVSVVNRIRRALAEISDRTVNRIGDISKAYGRAFGVERWAYELFAEEVIRGGAAFAVSLVITAIEPMLRNAAALGAWQVISPVEGTGIVEVITGLHEVQDKTYEQPTVLIAEQVTGEEEIPEGAVAVITPDAPDVLSHVSVRARNMRVLFATCHDEGPLKQLREARGKWLHLTPSASGAVTWSETSPPRQEDGAAAHSAVAKPTKGLKIEVPTWCGRWVVGMDEYRDGVVGAKSKNLAKLRGRLPANINLPASVTLPFGCFEQVLELPENKQLKQALAGIVARISGRQSSAASGNVGGLLSGLGSLVGLGAGAKADAAPHSSPSRGAGQSPAELLAQCRVLAMQVTVPRQVRDELEKAMRAAGIPPPENEERWALALDALRGVWASKYNDRAYYSLRKAGLDFDSVRMAVLVQRVVPAQYAFVIHTRNPSNNDEREVFCELVKGLGESLVSGMVPGSAVAFTAVKDEPGLKSPEVLCYASKSEAMFVRDSLIFRSDSNGEDLEGYAGAGLYDSITMDPTVLTKVDYMEDRLVQDPGF